MNENASLNYQLVYTTCIYIHSVYKESPRHYLSLEIEDHKIQKFKTDLCNHHPLKPGHITGYC